MLIVKMNKYLLKNWNKLFLGITCFTIVIIIFLFGLWPLNFHPKNEVEWLKDRNGIRFYGRGIAYSSESFNGQNQNFFQNNSVSIEILLQPEKVAYKHFAYIFSLYDGKRSEYFSIGQWNNSIQILGSRSINKVKIESIPKIGLGNALPDGEVQFITLSSDSEGTAIYMNGKLARFFPKYSLISKKPLTHTQILLGNSPAGNYYWTGNVFGLAIYNRLLGEDEVFDLLHLLSAVPLTLNY